MSERPFGTPCHTVRRNENRAISSLCRVTPPVTSEHFQGLLGSSPIPPSSSLPAFRFQLRLLPSPGITRLLRYYGPPRDPKRPGLTLASYRLIPTAITVGASRVASGPLCIHAVANTPAGRTRLVSLVLPRPLRTSHECRRVVSCVVR